MAVIVYMMVNEATVDDKYPLLHILVLHDNLKNVNVLPHMILYQTHQMLVGRN